MKKVLDKVNKKKFSWRNFLFHLHRKDISQAFELFRSNHLTMSVNRCAYYVLKTYYSTTFLRDLKKFHKDFGWSEETCSRVFDLAKTPWID